MSKIIEQDCLRILKTVNLNPLRSKKVLITGANGLLGQYLTSVIYFGNKFKKLNCRLDCLSLHKPNQIIKNFLSNPRIKFIKKDLSKNFRLSGFYNYIFHAAGYGQPAKFLQDPYSMAAVNVSGTYHLLETAKKNKGKFIFFSSAEVYGDIPKEMIPVPETYNGNCSTAALRSVYAEAKRLGEAFCFSFIHDFDTPAKIVRISHVYGPGTSIYDTRVMGDFIRMALQKKSIVLQDEGRAIKTFGYIGDVIGMILYVALHGRDIVYNVGGRESLAIKDLALSIGRYCGVPVKLPKKKSSLKHIGKDPMIVRVDLKKILGEMKNFRFTPFKTGLARTIEWNKQEFGL